MNYPNLGLAVTVNTKRKCSLTYAEYLNQCATNSYLETRNIDV